MLFHAPFPFRFASGCEKIKFAYEQVPCHILLSAANWMRLSVGSPIAVCLLILTSCSKPAPAPASKQTAPRDANVLLITLDTLRVDHLSCYGSKTVSTPNIDALAARGVRFAQAVAQVPLTTPSHASILTGTYRRFTSCATTAALSWMDRSQLWLHSPKMPGSKPRPSSAPPC